MRRKRTTFLSERNTRLTDRVMKYMVTAYAKYAKLEEVSCHPLRHTFCKNLADAGIRLEQIAYLAGHDSLETMRNIYFLVITILEKMLN